ncbi:hypothetical protein EDD86DRAFT_210915 [Gorgonomyces haynaldii]|nr:hypothetical protein EDD86DRAFT_210915 [Gorgonomyces haynaldii]
MFQQTLAATLCLTIGAYLLLSKAKQEPKSISSFKWTYTIVFILASASDWLQGAYTYSLYKSYGLSFETIAQLFVVGFLSAAVFGGLLAPTVDKFGRRNGCLLFCIVYFLSSLTVFFQDFWVLLCGRILGGIGTSLLFTSFEAWMVGEHLKQKLPSETLGDLFSFTTFVNGIVAICSGLVADAAVHYLGYTGPYQVSMFCLTLCFVGILLLWGENYGQSQETKIDWSLYSRPEIIGLGWMQNAMEIMMYAFVFLWAPTMEQLDPNVPFGTVFSNFMLMMMLGSLFYSHLTWKQPTILFLCFSLSLIAFSLAYWSTSLPVVYLGFNIFEFVIGMYFPAISTLRSKIVSEHNRAQLTNHFRIPLNLGVTSLTIGHLHAHQYPHFWIRIHYFESFWLISCFTL